ncbi:LOW QUALITY PROTEIN: hypothetical protein V2J09_004516 [Rumex salicifolius]
MVPHMVDKHTGPKIALAYAVSSSFTLLFAFCYVELSGNVRIADNTFSFLRIELGDLIPFLTSANILLEVVSATRLGCGKEMKKGCWKDLLNGGLLRQRSSELRSIVEVGSNDREALRDNMNVRRIASNEELLN